MLVVSNSVELCSNSSRPTPCGRSAQELVMANVRLTTSIGKYPYFKKEWRNDMKNQTVKWLFAVCGLFISGLFVMTSSLMGAEKPPIRVGLLLSYTGVAPLQTQGIANGVELAFEEVGWKAGGRKIEIVKEDDEYSPSTGLVKVRRLVEERKVNFVVGPVQSAVALAIYDYVRKQGVIQINPNAFSRELTSPEKACETIFRVIETTDQAMYPMGQWMAKKTPHRNVVIIATDFKAGHDSADAFKAGFEAAGGKVIKDIYPKLGTMDYFPFLRSVDVKGADATFAWLSGTDAVRFVQQYQESGMKKRLPLFGHNAVADNSYLATIGEAALGVVTSCHYTWTLDTPHNRAFVKAYVTKTGETPSVYGEHGYTAGKLIVAGIEALKGEVENSAQVAKELKRVASKVQTPSGPLAFDKYNQRIVDILMVKTEKRDGKLANVVIDNLGTVAQEDVWKWWRK